MTEQAKRKPGSWSGRAAEDLLHLMQWLSPAFPVGGYAYSHGLEWMIAENRVGNATEFSAWLGDVLKFGAGWSDGLLVSLAHRDAHPLDALCDIALGMACGKERELETMAQGTAFARAAGALTGTEVQTLPLPLAVGVHARRLDLETSTIVGAYLHAFLGNLTSVATRAVPLGQSEAQAVLASFAPAIVEQADRLSEAAFGDMGTGVLGSDLAAILHEEQDVRLFRS